VKSGGFSRRNQKKLRCTMRMNLRAESLLSSGKRVDQDFNATTGYDRKAVPQYDPFASLKSNVSSWGYGH
jgi:hypothetical protein